MKKLMVVLFVIIQCSITANQLIAQGVSINDNGSTPDNSAMLDIVSTTKGVLIPRMTTNEQLSISSPAMGLIIFNTDSSNFWFYNGTMWKAICTCDIITPNINKCDSFSCGDITDSRDGQIYKTIIIGAQCWMRENLNIGSRINGSSVKPVNGIIEKYCWNDSIEYCDGTGGKPKLGGFYHWDELMNYTTIPSTQGICPTGWHVPDDTEWQTLEITLGMCSGIVAGCSGASGARGTDQGDQLKLPKDCFGGNNCGTSCFDAILAGTNRDDDYLSYGTMTCFYTSSQYSATWAYSRCVDSSSSTISNPTTLNKTRGFNLRCVKD